jgi:hypothetical protein
MPKTPVERVTWNVGWSFIRNMRGISFRFFARVILMTASFALATLSLTTRVTGEEFVYAAGSIAAVMIASILRRKRPSNHSRDPSATS